MFMITGIKVARAEHEETRESRHIEGEGGPEV